MYAKTSTYSKVNHRAPFVVSDFENKIFFNFIFIPILRILPPFSLQLHPPIGDLD